MGVYEIWFASIPGIGNKRKIRLIEQFGSAEKIYELDRLGLNEAKNMQKKLLTEKNVEAILNEEFRTNRKQLEIYMKEKGIKTNYIWRR